MAFPTLNFAYFFLLVLTVSWSLRSYRREQKAFLLLASWYFYARFNLKLLSFLVLSSLVNYGIGEALWETKDQKKRKRLLVIGLVSNVLFLGFFKYYNFFRENLEQFTEFLGLSSHLPILEIALPLGISFYTFQGMAYLVDVYKDNAVRPKTLLDFLLFQSFFPQILAGPICSSKELLPQIMAPAPQEIPEVSRAISLIVTGLFKKIVLATFLATHMVDDAFRSPELYSSLELLIVVYAYTAQVYLDFSGYTDMARGIGLLLGFRIPENFNHPYRATNIGDFWRRWHITFSRWLRLYIYFPLGGSKCSRLRCYFNLLVTFVVCGIWHGPTWGFVIWGFIHSLALISYKASLDIRRDLGIDVSGPFPWWRHFLGWFATISLCAFARIWFKASDLTAVNEFWAGLFEFSLYGQGFELMVIFITALTIWMNFYGYRVFNAFVALNERIPELFRAPAWVVMAMVVFMLQPNDVAPFIYFGF